jgi:carbon storage regulator
MLVLSRKNGEAIVMPREGITIRVLEIRGERVRLGILAPAETLVHREEVWARIQTEQRQATPGSVKQASEAPLALVQK